MTTRTPGAPAGSLGFGLGGGVNADPFGDLDPNGTSLNLELSANFGMVEGSLTVSKHGSCPSVVPEVKPKACMAQAACTDGTGIEITEGFDPAPPKKIGAQAKLTVRQCGGMLF